MKLGVDAILSAIEKSHDPALTEAALANYLSSALPKYDEARTIDLSRQGITRKIFIEALEPIVEALYIDPKSEEDVVRINQAQQLVENLEGILSGTHTRHYGIKLPAVTNTTEVEKIGDAIHQIWQDTNSYRTRYKDMRIDGQPVIDKESYLIQHSIPVYYHDFYKLTKNAKYPEGILQEDIKRIPNTFLCRNNSIENFVGAQSYIEQLAALLDGVGFGSESAKEGLLQCLRKIHTDWYERNASWTVTYGEPATYDESSIETKYNGARQLFEIAKRFGALEIPEINEAFVDLMDQLKTEKFAPYQGLSVSQAYSEMARKTGFRPTILGDYHVAEFFEGYFAPLDFRITPERPESEQVSNLLREYYPEINGIPAERFAVTAPSTPPGSGARVYIISDREGQGAEKTIAVLKIQTGHRGLDEIVSNVAAFGEVPTSPNFKPVGWLSTGKLEGEDYFVLLDVAKKFEVESVFGLSFDECSSMVSKAALSLATLHGPALGVTSYTGGDLTTFKGNCWYDVRELIKYVSTKAGASCSPFEVGNPLSESTRRELLGHIKRSIEEYSDLVENNPATLSPSTVHGDMHGGNLFISDDTDLTMLIDYGGVTWTLGKNFGTGDRGNDLGRFIGSIFVEGVRRKLDLESETKVLIRSLLEKYLEQVGIEAGSEQGRSLLASAFFYAHRFIAVNAQDTEGKKCKPCGDESINDLRQRLFESWARFYPTTAQVPLV